MSKKWVFSIFFLLLALATSAHFILQSPFFSKKIESFAKSNLEKTLGKKVTIENTRLDLLSASIIFEGLSVHPESPDQTLLFFAKTLRVFFNINSFFTEVLVIRKVAVDAPEITLTDALVAEISSLKKITTQENTNKPPAPTFIVRKIQVTEGQISYAGKGVLKQATLSGIALEINPDLTMRNYELDLIAKHGTFATEDLSKEVEQFELEITVQADTVTIKKGKIHSGETDLSVHGIIDFSKKEPLALKLNIHFPLAPDITSTLYPVLQTFLTEHELSGALVFSGDMSGALPDLALKGTLVLPKLTTRDEEIANLAAKLVYHKKQLTLSNISGKLFSGTFSGALVTSFPGASTEIEGEEASKGLQVKLAYSNLPADRLIDISPLADNVTMPSLKGLFVSGKVNILLPGMRIEDMQARGSVLGMRLPLFSPPLLENAKPLQKIIHLFRDGKIRWLWSSGGLILNKATLDFPDLQLASYGQWHPSKGYIFETTLLSTDVKEVAAAFHIPLTGQLHVNGRLSEQAGVPTFEGSISAESGTLKGQSFTSFISEVTFADRRLAIKKAVLNIPAKNEIEKNSSPAGLYTATGLLHLDTPKRPVFDIKVTVKNGNPQEVFRFLHLKVPLYATANGTLSIQGEPGSFFVKGPLEISAGSLYGETFDQGRLDLSVTEKEVLFENIVLNHKKSLLTGKGGIAYNRSYWLAIKGDRLQVQDLAFLHWMPESLHAQVGLVVSGKGSFAEPQLHFVGAIKNLSYGDLQGVRGTIKADWVKHTVDFEANFPDKKIAVTGAVELEPSYPFSFDSEFETFQIDSFFRGRVGPIADMQVHVSGKLRGNGTLSEWARVNLSGHLKTITANLGGYELQNDGPVPILARDGTFAFQNARFKGENTTLTLNGDLKVLKRWGLFLKGKADLSLITFFSKKISSGSGTLHLDLSVSDTWDSPQLRGGLTMKAGKLRATDLSQPIEIAILSILFNEKQLILENLQGRIGGGNFHATGKAMLSGFRVNDFGFLLELEKVRLNLAKNLPATFAGELFFQRKALEQTLKGDLLIKDLVYEKKINLKQFIVDFTQKKRNSLSEETPIIGRTKINIHLYGNKNIWVNNNLAKIPLVVDLSLKGSFDQPNLLGRIDIAGGDIYFRHNTFKIISGSVNFLDLKGINPNFELTARTDVRNIATDRNYTIDLNLAGNLSQVTLVWNAFPSLPDTDILSLLAIRKTTADLALEGSGSAGTEATNFVVTEFLAEPVGQITGIIGEPVERITGIDHIRVEPSIDSSSASTTVGTRLTAEKRLLKGRLVVIYTTTLDPSEEEVIRMVYEINKHISLVGKREEDGQIGGDIRFRFEIR